MEDSPKAPSAAYIWGMDGIPQYNPLKRAPVNDGRRLKLASNFEPAGDQPDAIRGLTAALEAGERDQVLLGVTGSGKTFTMAHVIQNLNRPTLVLAPNKTLAAQLYGEMRDFFPENAVEYFVSYYDYYQPEAYVPRTDTYIEKDASVNEQIDRMRHAATRSLLERSDVVIVASVSCIYGIGAVETYAEMILKLGTEMQIERGTLLKRHCADKLKQAEARIEKILPGADGAEGLEPAEFD